MTSTCQACGQYLPWVSMDGDGKLKCLRCRCLRIIKAAYLRDYIITTYKPLFRELRGAKRMASFDRMATVTASTKRQGDIASGLSGDMAEEIASLKCLPLDPVDAAVAARMGLGDFAELLQTMTNKGPDIKEGDILVVGTTEYPVQSVEDWYWGPETADTLLLILKDPK